MKFLYVALFSLLLADCTPAASGPPATPSIVSPEGGAIAPADYTALLERSRQRRKDMAGCPDTGLVRSKTCLLNLLADSLLPAWYGTAWDYNGITRQPGQGAIACGYFVTTLLQDAGIPIARVKLAQAVSSELIRYACTGIRRYSRLEDVFRYLERSRTAGLEPGSGMFIIGLDNHVGFIVQQRGSSWMVDANMITGRVQKEKVEESAVLRQSQSFMIGNVLANEALIRRWRQQ